MPGLPAFGTNVTGLDACSILKAVTGDMVSKANSEMSTALSSALSEVKATTGVSSGTTTVDASAIVAGAIKGN
jgi:hypothetical protein